jgi:hypothetical protein
MTATNNKLVTLCNLLSYLFKIPAYIRKNGNANDQDQFIVLV